MCMDMYGREFQHMGPALLHHQKEAAFLRWRVLVLQARAMREEHVEAPVMPLVPEEHEEEEHEPAINPVVIQALFSSQEGWLCGPSDDDINEVD